VNLPTRTQISRVLCPIDFSECSEHALKHAAAVARWYGAHLRVLHVLAVAPPVSMLPPLASPPPAFTLTPDDRQQVLNHMRQLAARACGHDTAELVVQESANVAGEVLDQALAWHADLLVMGNHGHSGVTRFVLGSVSEKVLRIAKCAVLVVPHHAAAPAAPGDIEFDRILCGVDFSSSSLEAVTYALSLGAEAGAHVTLLNTIELPPELRETPTPHDLSVEAVRERAEAGQLARLEALIPFAVRDYCSVESTVVEGKASREILRQAAARQSDLIVMGVQGRSAINLAVFGSNAQDVIRQATCPVLLVRARQA
jgi:nucleotide-binding universal stress UspA family protein